MYVNVSIDASDLEDIDAHDLAELFEDLRQKSKRNSLELSIRISSH